MFPRLAPELLDHVSRYLGSRSAQGWLQLQCISSSFLDIANSRLREQYTRFTESPDIHLHLPESKIQYSIAYLMERMQTWSSNLASGSEYPIHSFFLGKKNASGVLLDLEMSPLSPDFMDIYKAAFHLRGCTCCFCRQKSMIIHLLQTDGDHITKALGAFGISIPLREKTDDTVLDYTPHGSGRTDRALDFTNAQLLASPRLCHILRHNLTHGFDMCKEWHCKRMLQGTSHYDEDYAYYYDTILNGDRDYEGDEYYSDEEWEYNDYYKYGLVSTEKMGSRRVNWRALEQSTFAYGKHHRSLECLKRIEKIQLAS
jgi:hypothetical protein